MISGLSNDDWPAFPYEFACDFDAVSAWAVYGWHRDVHSAFIQKKFNLPIVEVYTSVFQIAVAYTNVPNFDGKFLCQKKIISRSVPNVL